MTLPSPDLSFLRTVHAVIWDIDGVKYSYKASPHVNFYALCDNAVLEAAKPLLPSLSDAHILFLAQESYRLYRDCYGAFMPFAAQSGLPAESFRRHLFQDYHTILFTKLATDYPDYFDHARHVIPLFQQSPHIKHGALSHSSIEHWGAKVLDAIGVLPYFEKNAMLGMDDYDFVRKSDSVEPLHMILKRLDASADQACFVEDSVKNLERAKDLDGLHTIYIHYGYPLESLPSYIDAQFHDPADFMTHLIAQTKL